MSPWLQALLWTSAQAGLLALLVLALQRLLRNRVPARWRMLLWLVVLVRFAPLPWPESRYSLLNLLPRSSQAAAGASSSSDAPAKPLTYDNPAAQTLPTPATIGPETSVTPAPQERVAAAPAEASIATASSGALPTAQLTAPISPWTLLFAAGAAIIAARLVIATLRLHGILRRAARITEGPLPALLAQVRAILRLKTPIAIMATDELSTPAAAGFWQPRLLLPRQLIQQLSEEELRLVFLHEAAHIRRHDVLLNYALAALEAVHWFNPVVWIIVPAIRADRELACDELVLRHTAEPASYGRMLLKLLEFAPAMRCPAPAVGMVEGKAFFKRRIEMIASFRRPAAWLIAPAVITVGLGAGFLFANAAGMQNPSRPPSLSPTAVPAAEAPAVESATLAPPAYNAVPVNGAVVPPAYSSFPADPAAKLNISIKEIRFAKTPLSQALPYIADQAGINMHVNWAAFEKGGVDGGKAVSVNLSNLPAWKVLQVVLDDAAGGTGVLDYVLQDGVVTVSSASEIRALKDRNIAQPRIATPTALISIPTTDPSAAAVAKQLEATEMKLRELEAQRNVLMMRVGSNHPQLAALDQNIFNLKQGVESQMRDFTRVVPVSAIPAPNLQFQVYDVYDLLDVPATQQGVLTADQQSALKDLAATIQTMVKDPNMTVSPFNGMLAIKASEKSHDAVNEVLEHFKRAHASRQDQMRDEREKAAAQKR